jgi:hypothetical protein
MLADLPNTLFLAANFSRALVLLASPASPAC